MTRRLLPIRTVLEDPDWLGSLVGKPSFRVMRVLLIAAMGEALTADELEIFSSVTGRAMSPQEPVEEAWIIAGRRSGKSLGVAVAAAYLASCCDYRDVLARGELGVLPVMAGSVQQAGQIMNFLKGIFTGIPSLPAWSASLLVRAEAASSPPASACEITSNAGRPASGRLEASPLLLRSRRRSAPGSATNRQP